MLIRASQKNTSLSGRSRRAFTLVEVLIAFLIFGMLSAGLLYGYVQANRIAEWSSMSLGAQSYASQGLEQVLAAKWDTQANGQITADLLPPQSFTQPTNLPPQIDTNDVPQSGAPLLLTNYISVSYVPGWTNGPYLRQIRSACVWAFPMTGKIFTNTVVTLRSPDQ
jgi:prepilin-type N-terminal cleavage/methylation domain-containing protein